MSRSEVATVLANIRAIGQRMTAAADEAAEAVAHQAAADAAGRAPVASGALRDSLKGGEGGVGPGGVRKLPVDKYDRHIFDIGSELRYAATIEYDDTPMVRPAVNERAQELTRSIRAACTKAIR